MLRERFPENKNPQLQTKLQEQESLITRYENEISQVRSKNEQLEKQVSQLIVEKSKVDEELPNLKLELKTKDAFIEQKNKLLQLVKTRLRGTEAAPGYGCTERIFANSFENISNAAIGSYILLNDELPLPFEDSIKLAYEQKLPNDFDVHCGYGDDLYFTISLKGTQFTREQALACYLYTCEWKSKSDNLYSRLNGDLSNPDRSKAKKWRHYLHYLFGGLSLITPWAVQQDLYRGVSCDLVGKFVDKYMVGTKITWYACTSATTHFEQIMKFLPENEPRTIFTINRVFSGRPLNMVSSMPEEVEVLLPPASRFEIISVTKTSNMPVTWTVQLQQIEPLEKFVK